MGLYNFLNRKDPASFMIRGNFSLYQGKDWGPLDPEADEIPMCHHAFIKKYAKFAKVAHGSQQF